MEKISWIDHVRNWKALHGVEEKQNILHTIKRRKANWTGQILHRNCLLKHTIKRKLEGGIKVTERQGIRSKQLLDDLRERRGCWKLKEEALHHILWNE
jgi:hypothetical protein